MTKDVDLDNPSKEKKEEDLLEDKGPAWSSLGNHGTQPPGPPWLSTVPDGQ